MKVFEPLELKNVTIKNRITRSATHTNIGNLDGTISEAELQMFQDLAANEVGLIIAGQFFVKKEGIVASKSNELSDDSQIEAAAKIMDRVRPYGTKVIAQINHAGAKAMDPDRFAPSSLEFPGGYSAREMTVEEIYMVRQAFIDSAVRAKAAGFDGVQVHGAHDYLLCEFMTPSFNKREDAYGGNAEGRFRLVKEIIEGIKAACGEAYPVFIKVNTRAENENGHYQADLKQMAGWLKELGVEAIEYSSTSFKTYKNNDRTYFMEDAAEIHGNTDMPYMVVGGVKSFGDMEKVLKSGASMVSMSRPFISEPDLITKLQNGQEKARCVSCMKCFEAGDKRCILNK